MTDLTFFIYAKPVPKARPRKGKHGFYTPKETTAFEEHVGESCRFAMLKRGWKTMPKSAPLCMDITFQYGSAGRYKNNPKTSQADLDNLIKSVLDGVNGILTEDDAAVTHITAKKIYGPEDKITVRASLVGVQ